MATSSKTPECCLCQPAVPDMALGNQVSKASGARLLSRRSLALSVWPHHKALFPRVGDCWGEELSNVLVTRPLVISGVLHLAAVSTSWEALWSGLGFRMDAQEGVGSYFSTLSLRKAHFSASVQKRKALAHLGVWPGRTEVSVRIPVGNNRGPIQRYKTLH